MVVVHWLIVLSRDERVVQFIVFY